LSFFRPSAIINMTQQKAKTKQKNMTIKTSNSTSFIRRLSLFMASGFFVGMAVSLLSIPSFSQAETIGDLRDRSAQLEADINESNQEAENLHQEAQTLQGMISDLDADIVTANNQIELLNDEINRLKREIKEAEKEQARQEELLKSSMRALYKRGGASTFEMLVTSDSFSEFIDEQEYIERVKTGIQESTNKVIALQEQMEAQRKEQEELLAREQAAKDELQGARYARQNLLERTRGEEARYRALVETRQQELKEAEEAIARALAAGNLASLGPISQGDFVGRVGNTGYSTGAHLHLEARSSNQYGGPFGDGILNPNSLLGGSWVYPVNPVSVSQGFGNPWYVYVRGYHPGIDFTGTGSTIGAVASGEIVHLGCSSDSPIFNYSPSYGYSAVIQHNDDTYSVYGHMQAPDSSEYNQCRSSYGF